MKELAQPSTSNNVLTRDCVDQGRFRRLEAEEKIGRRVRALNVFSGVAQGTKGRVVAMCEEVGKEGFCVEIEWDLNSPTMLRDRFDKEQYESFVIEESSLDYS